LEQKALKETVRERVVPVIDWLINQRSRQLRTTLLMDGLFRKLRDIGVPVDRATLHITELHPLLRARSYHWDAVAGGAIEVGRAHGIQFRPDYLNSPIRAIHDGSAPIFRNLEVEPKTGDYPVIFELKEQGYTCYRALPLPFSNNQINVFTIATREPGGFSELDLALVDAAVPIFSTNLELRHLNRTAQQLLDTYLGHRTGERVLSGATGRGDAERIKAVIWSCDLRNFTPLAEESEMAALIELLNLYFGVMGRTLEKHGGEILKFIGDGLLAIFEIESDVKGACARALAAAEDALKEFAATREEFAKLGISDLRCGIALHIGEVMYGNIGTENRLDFTVIGPAVNLVSRMEPLTRDLEPPVILSRPFAERCGHPTRSLGPKTFKGIEAPQEVFALDYSADNRA